MNATTLNTDQALENNEGMGIFDDSQKIQSIPTLDEKTLREIISDTLDFVKDSIVSQIVLSLKCNLCDDAKRIPEGHIVIKDIPRKVDLSREDDRVFTCFEIIKDCDGVYIEGRSAPDLKVNGGGCR